MTKKRNGLQTASIILVIAAIALTVLAYPVQLALYWHYKTFPATNNMSWIKNTIISMAGQVVLLLGLIKSYDKEKPTTLLSISLVGSCVNLLYTVITYQQLSMVTFIYLIVLIIRFALFVFVTVDYFRGFKLIKASFISYAICTFPTLVGALAINVYYAATLSETYFVIYVKASVTSFASLCVAVAILLYLISRLKSAPKKENIPENM